MINVRSARGGSKGEPIQFNFWLCVDVNDDDDTVLSANSQWQSKLNQNARAPLPLAPANTLTPANTHTHTLANAHALTHTHPNAHAHPQAHLTHLHALACAYAHTLGNALGNALASPSSKAGSDRSADMSVNSEYSRGSSIAPGLGIGVSGGVVLDREFFSTPPPFFPFLLVRGGKEIRESDVSSRESVDHIMPTDADVGVGSGAHQGEGEIRVDNRNQVCFSLSVFLCLSRLFLFPVLFLAREARSCYIISPSPLSFRPIASPSTFEFDGRMVSFSFRGYPPLHYLINMRPSILTDPLLRHLKRPKFSQQNPEGG